MKLEVGKRYVRRDGKISSPMEFDSSGDEEVYPWHDNEGHWYTEEDRYVVDGEHMIDLISEYVEPAPEPIEGSSPVDEINVGTVVISYHDDVVKGIWRVTEIMLGGEGEEDLVELERLGMEDNANYGRAKVPRDLLRFNGLAVYP